MRYTLTVSGLALHVIAGCGFRVGIALTGLHSSRARQLSRSPRPKTTGVTRSLNQDAGGTAPGLPEWTVPPPLGCKDASGGLETVHSRHRDVHEDSAWLWHRQDG